MFRRMVLVTSVAELEAGVPIDNIISVDTRMSIIKEVSAKWLTSAFDYIKSHPDNGFVKAGIVSSESSSCHVDTIEDTDPFAPCVLIISSNSDMYVVTVW